MIIIILLVIFSFLLAKWITNRILKPRLEEKIRNEDEKLLYDQQVTHIKESLESLYIKLEEYSREVLSKLDAKILVLHNLLGEADKKIGLLNNILSASQSQNISESSQPGELHQVHEKVCELYRKGLKPAEIAKQLNLQVSEINLILALKNIPPPPANKS